jgi:hypothetical protein
MKLTYFLKQNKKNLVPLFILVGALLPIILPLFREGFFVTDDGEWMIIRLSAFYQAFSDGQFPVRFLGRLNHEYGYPVSTFLYPGFLYLGSVIHLLKIGFVDTVKIIIGLSVVSSAVFTFLWLRKFFDKKAAIWGAVFFVYSPYFLFDIYRRGSVGEVLALAVVPFILWQIERKSLFYTSLGIGFLIISHNSLAALFLFFIFAYISLRISVVKDKAPLIRMYTLSFILGIGLAGFFWLPIIHELPLTKFSQSTISNPFEYFADISLIGFSTLLVFLTSFSLTLKKASDKKRKFALLLLISGAASTFLASSYSGFLWSVLPASFIQFPFRLLSVTVISGAFLTAFVVSRLSGVHSKIFMVVLSGIFITSAYSGLTRIEYADKEEGFYITNSATTTVHDEYMPVWVEEKPDLRFDEKVEIIEGEGEIDNLSYNNKQVMFDTALDENSVIQINTIYWSGWEAFVDDKRAEISYNNPRGLMQISLLAGNHNAVVKFGETRIRLIGDMISIISFGALIVSTRKNKKWTK